MCKFTVLSSLNRLALFLIHIWTVEITHGCVYIYLYQPMDHYIISVFQVVGSQARILYSDQKGRVAIALAINKGIAEGRIKVQFFCVFIQRNLLIFFDMLD